MESLILGMASYLAYVVYYLPVAITALSLGLSTGVMKKDASRLPKTIGFWMRPDSAQIIDMNNIFDYMNGAGELYLGYRFDHMEVYEYSSDEQADILVELYYMDSSDDAWGLLSMDWGGDPVSLSSSARVLLPGTLAPPARALYGAGLLRLCSENVYARVMAYRETPAARDAVLALGRAIVGERAPSPEPDIFQDLTPNIYDKWQILRDRIVFFRSYQVLNSLYYLSHQNILDFDHSTEAVYAPYEFIPINGERSRVHLLHIKYPNIDRATKALEHFHRVYIPEENVETVETMYSEKGQYYYVEDGWLGYRRDANALTLAFGCPDIESVKTMVRNFSFE